MFLMTLYAYRRYASFRHATGVLAAAGALMMAAEFALLATPGVSAQPVPAAAAIVLEGRYSDEPQLLLMRAAPLELDRSVEP
jgi:hypothetical protein